MIKTINERTPLECALRGVLLGERLPFDLYLVGYGGQLGEQLHTRGRKFTGTTIGKVARQFDRVAVAHDGTLESYKAERNFWKIAARELNTVTNANA
jgi:hypothetical protein